MISRDTITALKRFGYGARPGESKSVNGDPRGWVVSQLDQPEAALMRGASLPDAVSLQRELIQYRKNKRALLKISTKDPDERKAEVEEKLGPRPVVRQYRHEMLQRTRRDIGTDHGFLERLVGFWSNHFCVSARKGGKVRIMTGAYEREVIRPNILGSFRDMLFASAQHPAMLLYLDNVRSFGPNSPAGRKKGTGLNENLAREILELHTVGVDGGYTQADVTNFAKIITGWTIGGALSETGAAFKFKKDAHEPGAFEVMGKTYAEGGVGQGEAVLDDLARHPSTAKFVATKFARHFVGEAVPQSLIDRLAGTFTATDGDLRELALELVDAEESWSAPAVKLLPPYDFLVSVGRAVGWRPTKKDLLVAFRVFGQQLWGPPSPAGWPDEDDAWVAPDAMLERLDWAQRIAEQHAGTTDVSALADDLLGPELDDHSRQVIERAGDRTQALSLLFMTPGFQRR